MLLSLLQKQPVRIGITVLVHVILLAGLECIRLVLAEQLTVFFPSSVCHPACSTIHERPVSSDFIIKNFLAMALPLCAYALVYRKVTLYMTQAKTVSNGWYLFACVVGCLIQAMYFINHATVFSTYTTVYAAPFLLGLGFLMHAYAKFIFAYPERRISMLDIPFQITCACSLAFSIHVAAMSAVIGDTTPLFTMRSLSFKAHTGVIYALIPVIYFTLHTIWHKAFPEREPHNRKPLIATAIVLTIFASYISITLLKKEIFVGAVFFLLVGGVILPLYHEVNHALALKSKNEKNGEDNRSNLLLITTGVTALLVFFPVIAVIAGFLDTAVQNSSLFHIDGLIFGLLILPIYHRMYVLRFFCHKQEPFTLPRKRVLKFIGMMMLTLLIFIGMQFSTALRPTRFVCDKSLLEYICTETHNGRYMSCPRMGVIRDRRQIIPGSCDR